MKEYQVYIKTTGEFIAEVTASSDEEAEELAKDIWNETHFHNLSNLEMGRVVAIPFTD